MDILNSEWLIAMLKKSSTSPELRILNLFDILNDWLDAPHTNTDITPNLSHDEHPLVQYLAVEAAKAGVALPELLANQLYFMAIAAAQEKLQHHNPASLSHAKSAAKALITAQTKRDFHIPKRTAYAVAACTLIVAGSLVGYQFWNFNSQTATTDTLTATPVSTMTADTSNIQASPTQTAALFARIEQMRKGDCQLIEALQLPDSYKKVYFENVVLGEISTNRDDQKLTNQLLDMVKCNYTPMLMANSKS
jgi:hypothetical protein